MEPPNIQNANLHLLEEMEASNLRRMGIQIQPKENDVTHEDYILYNTVFEKIKDLLDFSEHQINEWVSQL